MKTPYSKIILLAILVTSGLSAIGQNYAWVDMIGGAGTDIVNQMTIDADQNLIIAGTFKNELVFDGGTLTLNASTSTNDVFIAKYDSNHIFLWALGFGAGGSTETAHGLDVDASGNIYFTGGYATSFTLDGNVLPEPLSSDQDMFLTKFDPAGNLLWVNTANGAEDIKSTALDVDNWGNVIICGWFKDSMNVSGSTAVPMASAFNETSDIFLARYRPDGSLSWLTTAGGPHVDYAYALAVDATGASWITGGFKETMTIGGSSLTSAGGEDIFVAKFDSSGSPMWGSRAGVFASSPQERGYEIAIDPWGDAYVTGVYSTNADFDGTVISGGSLVANDFIAKYGPQGQLRWAKPVSNWFSGDVTGLGIAKNGWPVVSGWFRDSLSIGTSMFTTPSSYEQDIFVGRYDSAGNTLGAAWITGGDSPFEESVAMAMDDDGDVYLSGDFGDSITFGGTTLFGQSAGEAFLLKLEGNTLLPAVASQKEEASLIIFPNPNSGNFEIAFSSSSNLGNGAFVQIMNATGQIVYQQDLKTSSKNFREKLTLPRLPNGTYLLQLVSGQQAYAKRFILRR